MIILDLKQAKNCRGQREKRVEVTLRARGASKDGVLEVTNSNQQTKLLKDILKGIQLTISLFLHSPECLNRFTDFQDWYPLS